MLHETTTAQKFENRVRFNWGFHDGVADARSGLQRVDALTVDTIVGLHYDTPYAHGYVAGWYEAKGGASDCTTSTSAWNSAAELGHVSE